MTEYTPKLTQDQQKKAANPATVSPAYEAMAPRWLQINAVLGGTETMRASGKEFLPQHRGEDNLTYAERLQRAVLLNISNMTLDRWTGKPFSKPIQINEDVPPQVVKMMEDADLQGSDINTFGRKWFREGLAKSFCHVLVDYPDLRSDNPDAPKRTLADDRNENVRPYCTLVMPEDLIYARADIIDGVEKLTHVRIREWHDVTVGFIDVSVERIRVLERSTTRLYEKQKGEKGRKETWVLLEEWPNSLGEIPLVTFYAERDALMYGKPPLLDLTDLNIQHWQSESDQTLILTTARFPMLGIFGAIDKAKNGDIPVGPRSYFHMTDPQGSVKYIEHTGTAIEAGRKHGFDVEERMAYYGIEYQKPKAGNPVTATEAMIESKDQTSPLQDAATRFGDAMDMVLYWFARWLKLPAGGTVKVYSDFQPDTSANALTLLAEVRKMRDISRDRFMLEMQRKSVVGEDYDPVADAKLLEKEQEAAMEQAAAMLELDPGAKEPAPASPAEKKPKAKEPTE